MFTGIPLSWYIVITLWTVLSLTVTIFLIRYIRFYRGEYARFWVHQFTIGHITSSTKNYWRRFLPAFITAIIMCGLIAITDSKVLKILCICLIIFYVVLEINDSPKTFKGYTQWYRTLEQQDLKVYKKYLRYQAVIYIGAVLLAAIMFFSMRIID